MVSPFLKPWVSPFWTGVFGGQVAFQGWAFEVWVALVMVIEVRLTDVKI